MSRGQEMKLVCSGNGAYCPLPVLLWTEQEWSCCRILSDQSYITKQWLESYTNLFGTSFRITSKTWDLRTKMFCHSYCTSSGRGDHTWLPFKQAEVVTNMVPKHSIKSHAWRQGHHLSRLIPRTPAEDPCCKPTTCGENRLQPEAHNSTALPCLMNMSPFTRPLAFFFYYYFWTL